MGSSTSCQLETFPDFGLFTRRIKNSIGEQQQQQNRKSRAFLDVAQPISLQSASERYQNEAKTILKNFG
jgi:hypothetical protein